MSSTPTDTFDGILVNIAKEIYGNGVVNDLGNKLGFNPAEIARFNEENAKQGSSYMGTLDMLRTWRQKHKRAEQREILKAAMEDVSLLHLVDKYLSADDMVIVAGVERTKDVIMTFIAEQIKFAGINVKNKIQGAKGEIHVELIIRAERSTREILLKTISEADFKDVADFLIFQQKADDWELLEARSITRCEPSSKLTHCAVFIYRNGVPPNLTEDDFKVFEDIINERTNPTVIDVSGEASTSCLQQLLNAFLDCTYNDLIVTVSPGDVQMARSLSGNQTREQEHQHEATLKKKARGRIQYLTGTISTLEKEIIRKDNELAACKYNISEKHCEKKNIQKDIVKAQEKLEQLNEALKKAQHEVNELKGTKGEMLTQLKTCKTVFRMAGKGLNQTEKNIEEVFTESKACANVPMEAGNKLEQTEKKTEEGLTEIPTFANKSKRANKKKKKCLCSIV